MIETCMHVFIFHVKTRMFFFFFSSEKNRILLGFSRLHIYLVAVGSVSLQHAETKLMQNLSALIIVTFSNPFIYHEVICPGEVT